MASCSLPGDAAQGPLLSKQTLLRAVTMHRLLPFLSALMLVLVLWTGSVAHAAEAIDCGEVTTSVVGHFEGDRDEVPADSDKATPHHHNACHGHCVAMSSSDDAALPLHASSGSVTEAVSDFRSGAGPGASLRPPIA